jgi:AcrR family transcriptional regulator
MNEKSRTTRRTRKQSRPVENEETRSTILRVSQKLFMEYGYRAISTRQIAEACGLTQPALYHHFTDKQQLYAAMAKEGLASTGAILERIAQREESVDERLRQIARYLLNTTRHDLSQMLHDMRHELDEEIQHSLVQAFQAGIIQPLSIIFKDAQRTGILKTPEQGGCEPTIGIYLFLSMISHFLSNRRGESIVCIQDDHLSIADAAAMTVRIILYGLAR